MDAQRSKYIERCWHKHKHACVYTFSWNSLKVSSSLLSIVTLNSDLWTKNSYSDSDWSCGSGLQRLELFPKCCGQHWRTWHVDALRVFLYVRYSRGHVRSTCRFMVFETNHSFRVSSSVYRVKGVRWRRDSLIRSSLVQSSYFEIVIITGRSKAPGVPIGHLIVFSIRNFQIGLLNWTGDTISLDYAVFNF